MTPIPGRELAAHMERHLQQKLQPTAVEVIDESHLHEGHPGANGTGFGTHFRVRIQGPGLADLGRVSRHRLIYDALSDYIEHQGVHALAIEAGA